VAGIERRAARILRQRRQPRRQDVPQVHPVQHGASHGIVRRLLLHGGRRALEVEGDSGREHLDVPEFLRGGVEQEVAELRVAAARAPGLEHVLQGDPHLALDAADGLLQRLGEDRVGGLDPHRILKSVVLVEHRALLLRPAQPQPPAGVDVPRGTSNSPAGRRAGRSSAGTARSVARRRQVEPPGDVRFTLSARARRGFSGSRGPDAPRPPGARREARGQASAPSRRR
jgi:hypothetical protein